MTTIEKLFFQIFDRKNQIIEQVRQQTDIYSQHLASKLLIDGITPPPWLWNPSFNIGSIDSKDFNKEELLSELLLPHPRPSASYASGSCSLYNLPVVIGDNKEVSERFLTGTHGSNEGFNVEHRPTSVSKLHDDEIGSALNSVPKSDLSASSPQGRTSVRISSVITQQANGEPSEGLLFETHASNRGYSVDDRPTSLSEFHHNGVGRTLTSAPELDQSTLSPQGQNEVGILNNLTVPDSLSRIQRSKSRQKALALRKTAEAAAKLLLTKKTADGVCYRAEKISSIASKQQQPDKELLGLAKYSGIPSDEYVGARAIGECLSKGKDTNPYCGRITRSRSSCNLFAHESKSKLDNSFEAAKEDGGRMIRSQSNPSEGISKPVHTSKAASPRVTRAGKSLLANCSNGSEERQHQNGPSSELILHCPDINATSNPAENAAYLIETEVILDGTGKVQAACSESNLEADGPSVGMEGFDLRPPSNCRMFVKPKTLFFDNMEKASSIDIIRPMMEKEMLDKLPEKRCCILAKSSASLEKFIFSNSSRKSLEKQSLGRELTNQLTEGSRGFLQTCLKECVMDEEQVSELRVSTNVEDNSDAVRKIESSPILHGEEIKLSNVGEDIDRVLHEEVNSVPNHQVQKCELVCYQMVRGEATPFSSSPNNSHIFQASLIRGPGITDQSPSSLDAMQCHAEKNQDVMCLEREVDSGLACSDEMLLHKKSSMREDGFSACDAVDSIYCEARNFLSSEVRELDFLEENSVRGGKVRSAMENTWPQLKRRRIKGQGTHSLSVSPRFGVESHYIGGSTDNRYLKSVGRDLGTFLQFQSSPSSYEGDVVQSNVNKSPDVEIHQKDFTQEKRSPLEMPIEKDEVGFEGKGQSTRYTLSPEHGEFGSFAVSRLSNGVVGDSQVSFGQNAATADATGIALDLSMHGDEKNYNDLLHFSDINYGKDAGTADTTSIALDISMQGDEKNYDDLLHFSDTHYGRNAGTADETSIALDISMQGDEKYYEDLLHFSDTNYGRTLTIPPISPVSKLWGRVSWKSNSSEKTHSSNPELTCFPIQEDPSISEEEEEEKDEVANSTQEDIFSTSMNCDDKRNPVAEITQANVFYPPSVSAVEIFLDRSSLDSVNTEVIFTGTHGRVKQKPGKHHSNKRRSSNEAKENQTSLASTNFIGRAIESLSNRFSKPTLPRKTTLSRGGQSVSDRESKRNNIISNISSFVPLVQQKQAAAVVTGKRDIKVKALEAAEAAKRLEEKRQNERKMKKEALKIERARIEQETLRQAELMKKKKEDERKKKDVDVAARKRLREEEERKEKERKRKRIEEKQQQQREQEKKLRVRKVEKELRCGAIDEKVNLGTLTSSKLQEPQKVDVDRRDDPNIKKADIELSTAENLANDVRQPVLEGCEASRNCDASMEVANMSREKSYEISPYQCSDDEDDEEDEISPRKSIPSWASKKSVAFVHSSQQDLDPDIIFPLGSFCSMDEVIRPRKLQLR